MVSPSWMSTAVVHPPVWKDCTARAHSEAAGARPRSSVYALAMYWKGTTLTEGVGRAAFSGSMRVMAAWTVTDTDAQARTMTAMEDIRPAHLDPDFMECFLEPIGSFAVAREVDSMACLHPQPEPANGSWRLTSTKTISRGRPATASRSRGRSTRGRGAMRPSCCVCVRRRAVLRGRHPPRRGPVPPRPPGHV